MPRVSVVIPTFNRERFVGFSIESVLHQTYKDFELIVVDDGSTDNTSQVLAAYGERIRVIRQDNAGVSEGRNKGIRAARGEWISFLDSDDVWMPEYLEWQMHRADQQPKIITHITNAVTIQLDETREDLFQGTHLAEKFEKDECIILEHPLRTIINHRPWFCQAIVMKREFLFKAGLFDPTLTIAEDLDIIAKMALKGPFSISKKVLVKVIRRKEAIDNLVSQGRKKSISTYKAFEKVLKNLLGSPGLNFAEKIAIYRALSYNWRALGNIFIIANRKPQARKYYIKSFFIYPSIRSVIKSIASAFPGNISAILVKDAQDIMPGEDIDKI